MFVNIGSLVGQIGMGEFSTHVLLNSLAHAFTIPVVYAEKVGIMDNGRGNPITDASFSNFSMLDSGSRKSSAGNVARLALTRPL